jgi:hypothetical protein
LGPFRAAAIQLHTSSVSIPAACRSAIIGFP